MLRLRNHALITALVIGLASTAMADPFSVISVDVPKAIPDVGAATSTLTVPNSGAISDVNVFIDVTHTLTSDLDIFLLHADTGTSVQLFNNHGGGANLSSTTFDDAAATAIGAGVNPFSSSYRPFVALSAFNGENVSGTWVLSVVDTVGGNTGSINSFLITGAFAPAPVPEPGTYALFGLGALGLAGLIRRRKKAAAASTAN